METVIRYQPQTNQVVKATRFEVWSWMDMGRWFAACPDMPNTLIWTVGSRTEAVKICFTRVTNQVVESKTARQKIPWGRWKPVTRGLYSVKKFSIS